MSKRGPRKPPPKPIPDGFEADPKEHEANVRWLAKKIPAKELIKFARIINGIFECGIMPVTEMEQCGDTQPPKPPVILEMANGDRMLADPDGLIPYAVLIPWERYIKDFAPPSESNRPASAVRKANESSAAELPPHIKQYIETKRSYMLRRVVDVMFRAGYPMRIRDIGRRVFESGTPGTSLTAAQTSATGVIARYPEIFTCVDSFLWVLKTAVPIEEPEKLEEPKEPDS